MSPDDLVRARVAAHFAEPLASPAEAVRASCAVQAQDFRASLWGIALRTPDATERDVEHAIAAREIVRTWPMRGTLHFVAAEDVRWMLALLAPRGIARAAGRHRQLGLDEATLDRARAVLERALAGRTLTRAEIFAQLDAAGISTEGQRGVHVLANLSMKGVICCAAHRGKQQTFALLDEWVPRSRALDGEEALGELASRYLVRHAPASVADLAWWSGLPIGIARRAVSIAGIHGNDGMLTRSLGRAPRARSVHLLPAFDEYTVAYADRRAFLDPAHAARTRNGIMSPVLLIDGRIAGVWSRTTKARRVAVHVETFVELDASARRGIERAASRYGSFLELPADLSIDVR